MRRFKREVKARHDDQEYMKRVAWIAMRVRMKLGHLLVKQGPNFDERHRRTIKNSLISFTSMADFTRYQAGTVLRNFLDKKQ